MGIKSCHPCPQLLPKTYLRIKTICPNLLSQLPPTSLHLAHPVTLLGPMIFSNHVTAFLFYVFLEKTPNIYEWLYHTF